jgi:branched-chain amino acid transport system substrate-binding protein
LPTTWHLGAGLAFYAADTLKLKKIAVIDDRTAYGQGVAEVFSKVAKTKGIEIVDQQFTTDKATDFMAILTAIKSKKPDAIFYGGMDAQAGAMLRQMDQLGMSAVKYFGGDGICTTEIIKIAAGAKSLDGVVCAEGGSSMAKMPGGTAWKAKYDAKYPGQFQIYSPYTYDATFVLVDAMKRANSTDPKVYTPKLVETNFKGVTANIAFEPTGEMKNPSMTLSTYTDGKKDCAELIFSVAFVQKATFGWLFSWPVNRGGQKPLPGSVKLSGSERWMSGLSHTPGKRAWGKTLRGFESRLLRQII